MITVKLLDRYLRIKKSIEKLDKKLHVLDFFAGHIAEWQFSQFKNGYLELNDYGVIKLERMNRNDSPYKYKYSFLFKTIKFYCISDNPNLGGYKENENQEDG